MLLGKMQWQQTTASVFQGDRVWRDSVDSQAKEKRINQPFFG